MHGTDIQFPLIQEASGYTEHTCQIKIVLITLRRFLLVFEDKIQKAYKMHRIISSSETTCLLKGTQYQGSHLEIFSVVASIQPGSEGSVVSFFFRIAH